MTVALVTLAPNFVRETSPCQGGHLLTNSVVFEPSMVAACLRGTDRHSIRSRKPEQNTVNHKLDWESITFAHTDTVEAFIVDNCE